MNTPFFYKASVGAAGMAIGAAVVSLIRVAAIDGIEAARERHLAEIASGLVPSPRVVVRNGLHCPNLADSKVKRLD